MRSATTEVDKRVPNLTADLLDLPSACVETQETNGPAEWPSGVKATTLREATDGFQREMVLATLARQRSNRAAAAREPGLEPGNLNRLMKRLQIDPSEVTGETR